MNEELTFADYLKAVTLTLTTYPEWRLGQAFYNVLDANRPDIARKIQGTMRDPFYQDTRIPTFLTFVLENWDTK
jgi:hypothetical protein